MAYTPNGGSSTTLATIGYQADGDLNTVTYANGTVLTVGYDSLDRQTKTTDQSSRNDHLR